MHLLAKKCKFTVFLTNLLLTNADDSRIQGASFNIGLKIDEKFPDFPFTRIRIEVARTDTGIERKLSVLRSSYIDAKATESVQLTNEGFI
uniref:Putative secreted protein n=1 Tax=Lutzomyia longipalpis TaxID=7200 RepID=A0A7G3AN23_LUTLO